MIDNEDNLKTFECIDGKLYSEDLCFVSLGVNCYSRLLIEIVFNIRKMYSCDHRLPFDGSIHRFDSLINIMNTDFSCFYSKEHLDYDLLGKYKNPNVKRFQNTFYGSKNLVCSSSTPQGRYLESIFA